VTAATPLSAAKASATPNKGAEEGAASPEDIMTAAKATGPAIYRAIASVMADMAVEGIGKDKRNTQQGYNFRGIDDVYNALAPILAKRGLIILPRVVSRECVERTTAQSKAIFYTTVQVEFTLVAAEDGSSHVVTTYGEAMDSADKSTNKAMSAAFKYAAMQAFCIPTEGDNDADATTHEVRGRHADDGPSAAAQFAADQLRQAKTGEEFKHFWNSQKEGLRQSLNDGDYAHVVKVMQTEAKRFAEKSDAKQSEKSTANDFPGDTPFDDQKDAA